MKNDTLNQYQNKLRSIGENYPILKKSGKRLMLDVYDTIEKEQPILTFDEYTRSFNNTVEMELYDRFYDIVYHSTYVDISNDVIIIAQNDYEELHQFMDSMGWSLLSRATEMVNDDYRFVYTPKYSNEEDFSYYYYYVTPLTENIGLNISIKGITPNMNGDLYGNDSFINLFTYNDILNLKQSIKLHSDLKMGGVSTSIEKSFPFISNLNQHRKFTELVVYKITSSKIKDGKFFLNMEDPKNETLWTYKNIPPVAISYLNTLSTYLS
jgi:hypothetical protein